MIETHKKATIQQCILADRGAYDVSKKMILSHFVTQHDVIWAKRSRVHTQLVMTSRTDSEGKIFSIVTSGAVDVCC